MPSSYIESFGVLRIGLLILVGIAAMLAPEAQVRTILEWPLIIPTLIIPTIAPLILMVTLFDLMMATILCADNQNAERKKSYRFIAYIQLAAAILLTWRWLPFFMALGN